MNGDARARVIAEALSWLGTPYHRHGRIKGVGVDCATLLCEVYEAAGVVSHVDPGLYSGDWHLHRSEEQYLGCLNRYGTEVDAPQPGDVIVWRFGRCFSHGAILCENETVAHSYLNQGVILDRRDAQKFTGREAKYFTFMG